MTDVYTKISYWNVTKNIYYSLLFIFPMLFLYESMCWIQYFGQSEEIRNGADVLIRQIIVSMGNGSEIVYGFLLMVIYFGVMFLNRRVVEIGKLKFNFLLLMIVESLVWSIIFIIIMSVS